MKVLDLFSGIGGFSLGLGWAGFETVGFCEIDPYCRSILRKHWPEVPIHEDIRKLDGYEYRGAAHVVCGGFPCQPASQAGKRAGESDDRWLWPEMYRVIREVRPEWVIAENVSGLATIEDGMVFERCLSDLEAEGYGVQTFDIPACSVGAPHRRQRLWIVANANVGRREIERIAEHRDLFCEAGNKSDGLGEGGRRDGPAHSDTGRQLLEGWRGQPEKKSVERPTEPPVCGADHGFSDRVARLRALGNAVVPQIPMAIGEAIQRTRNN